MRVAATFLSGVLCCAACAHGNAGPGATGPTSQPPPAREAESADLGTLEVAGQPGEPYAETPAEGQGLSHGALPPVSEPRETQAAGTARGVEPAQAAGTARDAAEPNKQEADLRERIQRSLAHNKELSYTAQRVRIEVKASDVTVRGEVRTAHEKREVEQLIQRVSGVRHVNNALAVIDQSAGESAPAH